MLALRGASMTLAVSLFGSAAAAAVQAPVALQRRFAASNASPSATPCSSLELIFFLSAYEKHGPSLGVVGVS